MSGTEGAEVPAVRPDDAEVVLHRAPDEVVAEAHIAAKVLKDVIDKTGGATKMGAKEHIHIEAWQTVGKFYGITAQITDVEYVEYGDVKGFNAKAEAVNQDGRVVSTAESMCMTDEPTWKNRPLYAIKSMAQTRACGKVYRNCLSWVVVLAGYSGTPMEEMPSTPKKAPQKATTAKKPPTEATPPKEAPASEPPPAMTAPGDLTAQENLYKELALRSGCDLSLMEKALHKFSSFEASGKTKGIVLHEPEEGSTLTNIWKASDKWCNTTIGKCRKSDEFKGTMTGDCAENDEACSLAVWHDGEDHPRCGETLVTCVYHFGKDTEPF